jgi:chromosome segregation ATPase
MFLGEVSMGIRSRLASVVLGGSADTEVRDAVEDALTARNLVKPSDVATLREKVETLGEPTGSDSDRISSIEQQLNAAQKEIQMVMGAVEAVNKQLQELRSSPEQALAAARQAGQHSTTARATAEATSDGLAVLEDKFASLIERLGTAGLDWNRTQTGGRATCTYSDCHNRHHARNLCKKHYRLWRRSQLENWVSPDGVVLFSADPGVYKVDKRHAGQAATLLDEVIQIGEEKTVPAKRIDN